MLWTFRLVNLDERPHPDGSPILRPVVPLTLARDGAQLAGVVDSGSPISAADASLFRKLGIDVRRDEPLYELGLTIGGQFVRAPAFLVTLWLHPPGADHEPIAWELPLVARSGWRFPFAVLLGQRGWFDTFPTRIDAVSSTVDVP